MVLIPKVETTQSVRDLRPVSLCNVVYKIISKVLSNRLNEVLPDLVDRAQSAFVAGRAIQDNVLIAFEVIHAMKNKWNGRRGDMALKIDISKAYDRVDWNYLKRILLKLGFSDKWVGWMMMCVWSVRYSIQVNEPHCSWPWSSTRDPLSPYLFILCTEGLSATINRACSQLVIHENKICRRAPGISHLLFVDDSLLFCWATIEEGQALKSILNDYELVSGQAIKFDKSGIFFSRNVKNDRREELKKINGCSSTVEYNKISRLTVTGGEVEERHFYVHKR